MKALRYYAEFYSSKNKKYRVEVRTESPAGTKELELASSPVTVEYGGEKLFQPAIMSQASIKINTPGPLIDLFTGTNQGVDVRIIDMASNKTDWFGYFSPNTYSSDYNTDIDALSLEAVDTLSSLANIRYSYIGGGSSEFKTFKEVLIYILDKADPDRLINNLYIQKTLRLSSGSTTNLWDDLIIQEINFYDELDEAMNLQDVLKEMLKYLGMTIVQYQDSYYIFDHLFVKHGKTGFFLYDRTTGVETSVNIPLTVKNLYTNIGVYSANANLSIGELYNKQTIRANRLNVESVIPDVLDDDDLINQNVDPSKYYTTQEIIKEDEDGDGRIDDVNYTLLTGFFKSKANFEWRRPFLVDSDNPVGINLEEITIDDVGRIYRGTYWQKVRAYKSLDGEPSSYGWKTYLTICDKIGALSLAYDRAFLSLKSRYFVLVKGGYFILNLTFKMSEHSLAHDVFQTKADYDGFDYFTNGLGSSGFDDTWIPCRLAIGDYYYDGDKFVNYEVLRLKEQRGYYEGVIGRVHYRGAKWYYYIDQYGYKRFVTQAEYNALPSGIERYSAAAIDNRMYYFTNSSGDRVFTTEEYYFECLLKDRFLLIHKNKEGDKIFDIEKTITNTVSYKMNLIDPEDGKAIKVPDHMLTGFLIFELYKSNHLAVRPCRGHTAEGAEYGSATCAAFHISDMLLKYTTTSENGAFGGDKDNTDVVYSNIINDENVKEAEDIELYINTYKDRAAYSSVVVKKDGEYDFLSTLYSEIEGGSYEAEDFLIDKLCTHNEQKRYIYENNLNRKLDFLSRVYEDSLNATMLVASMSIDYATDSCQVKLIEP